jgi:hypothetical protein
MLTDNARPAGGSSVLINEDGINVIYDPTREKTLSVFRDNVMFGIDHKNIVGKRWMRLAGKVNSVSSGYKLPRDGVITAITIQSENIVEEARINIRTNNQIENLHTANLTTTKDLIEDNLNIDINKGDYIQLFLSVLVGSISYPVVNVEIAWR